jgi:hypothetical protein
MSTPSLLNVPYRLKAGTLYSQIPETGLGDFAVTRSASNVATRINSLGFIETVADNVPRLDYPLGGAVNGCPALLVEPSATNVNIFSEDITNATWDKLNVITTNYANVVTSPDGSTNADKLIPDTTSDSYHGIQLSSGRPTLTSGVVYTFSVFAKAQGYDKIRVQNFSQGVRAQFDLTTGTLINQSGTTSTFIIPYGNGWYRIGFTYTQSGTLAAYWNTLVISTNDNSSSAPIAWTGNGTDSIAVYGHTIEEGPIATSYIPTTTAAITRGADVINKTGVSSLIGQTEGTIYAEFEYKTNAAERRLIALSNGTSSDRIMVWTLSNVLYAQVEGDSMTLANPITEGYHKLAFAYQQNGVSGTLFASLDGGAVVSGTSAAFPASLTDINIGKTEATATPAFFWNARIRASALYPNRLSNTELQALTA